MTSARKGSAPHRATRRTAVRWTAGALTVLAAALGTGVGATQAVARTAPVPVRQTEPGHLPCPGSNKLPSDWTLDSWLASGAAQVGSLTVWNNTGSGDLPPVGCF
ncbi:hypothetical protein GCM10009665_59160 [Kitasatospora nipponensis]|uniref:Uncharacterized protein n=1 Tax=Kitasatospora nipponensis TaxID=258049 RepID=A0ABN1WTU7_9ACTN